jgi:peptidoglycan hydrolase CwlO-like protein
MGKSPESGTGKHNKIPDPNIDPELGSLNEELRILRNNLEFYKKMRIEDSNADLAVRSLEKEIEAVEEKIEARKKVLKAQKALYKPKSEEE